ncbi:HprK-related kinase B [Desulfoluna spongiiphila]|uniref:HprK-related kinase B n=1 Tax=Desulfoluna spongiiphila TaxID=419481 RepID=UPI00125270E7|nr:HprK-related kinase B [Desulfoluna spongiiphila]VVS91906.1 hprk-related kinase b [Desulfoluna spongiiphila]
MNLDGASCGELIASVRGRLPAEHGLTLGFGDCLVEVSCSTHALAVVLADYFQEFLCPPRAPDIFISLHESAILHPPHPFVFKQPEPCKTGIKEAWVDFPDGRMVRKERTGMLFLFGGEEHLAVGPCLANTNQVVNFINNRFIAWKLLKGSLLGHAAGVVLNNRGLALAGISGAGKSTLALHLMGRGACFVSNDRLMVEKKGTGLVMCGVGKQPRINPGTALTVPGLSGVIEDRDKARYASLSRDTLWALEEKHDAPIHRYYGSGRFVLEAPLTGLVILNWKPTGAPTTFRAMGAHRSALLASAFVKRPGLFFKPPLERGFRAPDIFTYAALLSSVEMFELSGGTDFAEGARACLGILSPGVGGAP